MTIDELVAVDVADVYKQGTPAARLRRLDARVEFAYLPDYDGPDVATTLPRRAEPLATPGRAVPPYFAGLLPEGRRLTAIRRAVKTSADDDFSLLLAVGADTIGDVQVMPHGEPPPVVADHTSGAGNDLDTISFAEVFATSIGVDPDRAGIAGVQDKVSGRMISVPVRARGVDFILKLDPPEFPHLVANEAFFARLAAACGLDVATNEVMHDRDGRPGLLVTRFDRVQTADGSIAALACEDACQAAGRYPADKYALTTEAAFDVLAPLTAAPAVARRALLQQVVLAIVTGNGDLHAKNLAVLHTGEWRVSPAYDLPSSYPYGDSTLAMSIAGTREGQVSRRRLLALATSIGLPQRSAELTIDDIVDRAEPWLDRLHELPFDERRIGDLRRFMAARIRLLRGRGR